MIPGRAAMPGVLLGVTSLDLPARATRDRALEVAGRHREPEALAVTMVKALDAGAGAVYAVPSARMRSALRELRRAVPVLARLPLMPPSADVHHDHPLLARHADGEGGRLAGSRGQGLAALAQWPFATDLAGRVAARCEAEARALGARAWAGLAVSAGVTDLALAAGNARFFERMVRRCRRRFGGACGFETLNLGLLLERLREWGVAADFAVGAVNPRGVGMRPEPAFVLAEMRKSEVPTLACELRAGGTVPLAEGARFALAGGARGLVVDLVDVDDLSGELRSLAGR